MGLGDDIPKKKRKNRNKFNVVGREGVRENPDGSHSTHLMQRETFDGENWFAFPTLFQNKDKSWEEYSPHDMVNGEPRGWREAYKQAEQRGELYKFGKNLKRATKFADEGSWKKPMNRKIRKSKNSGWVDKYEDGTKKVKKNPVGGVWEDLDWKKEGRAEGEHYGELYPPSKGQIMYVDSPDDPRYKAYQDSLSIHNKSLKLRNQIDKLHESTDYKKHEVGGFSKPTHDWIKTSQAIRKGEKQLDKDTAKEIASLESLGQLPPIGYRFGHDGYDDENSYYTPYADRAKVTNYGWKEGWDSVSDFFSGDDQHKIKGSDWEKEVPDTKVMGYSDSYIMKTKIGRKPNIEVRVKESKDSKVGVSTPKWTNPTGRVDKIAPRELSRTTQERNINTNLQEESKSVRGKETFINARAGEVKENKSYWQKGNGKSFKPVRGSDTEGTYGYEKLEDGTAGIKPPDKKEFTPLYGGEGTLIPEVVVDGGEAPGWLEDLREYKKMYPIDIKKEVEKAYEGSTDAIGKIDDKGFRRKLKKDILARRNKDAIDYVGGRTEAWNPKDDRSRADWLNSMSPEEEQIVTSIPKNKPTFWTEFQKGIEGTAGLMGPGGYKGPDNYALTGDEYSDREKEQRLQQSKETPFMSKVGDVAGLLSPASIPGKAVQAGLMDDYSIGDALSGTKNDATEFQDLISDLPLDLIGIGEISSGLKGTKKVLKALKKTGAFDKLKDIKNINKLSKGKIDAAFRSNKLKLDPSGLLVDTEKTLPKSSIIDPSAGRAKNVIDPMTGAPIQPKQSSLINKMSDPNNSPIGVLVEEANKGTLFSSGDNVDSVKDYLKGKNPDMYGKDGGFLDHYVEGLRKNGKTEKDILEELQYARKKQKGKWKKNLARNFKKAVKKVKEVQNIPENVVDAFGGSLSVLDEIGGELMRGKSNRAAIKEGNEWLVDWINHRSTQEKMYLDLGRAAYNSPEGQLLANFNPNIKEYPLKQQIIENVNQWASPLSGGAAPIHRGNLGVSYSHQYSPKEKLDIAKGIDDPGKRYGGWLSRTGIAPEKTKVLTTVHEGTHEWIDAETLTKSGQREKIENMLTTEYKEATSEWSNLKYWEGKSDSEIESIMGKKRAHLAYIADPTEMHARIMELRKQAGIKPGEHVPYQKVNELWHEIHNSKGMFKTEIGNMMEVLGAGKDEESVEAIKKMSYLMNNLWAVPPAVIGGAGVIKANEKEKGTQSIEVDWLKGM